MEYKITEVTNVRPNVYQGMSGVDFKVEGNDNKISALTKSVDKFSVGSVVNGEIKPKDKDGKTFYNFYEQGGKPTATPQNNDAIKALTREVQAVNTNVLRVIDLLKESGLREKTSDGAYEPNF